MFLMLLVAAIVSSISAAMSATENLSQMSLTQLESFCVRCFCLFSVFFDDCMSCPTQINFLLLLA